jgi:hypothetical protein
MREFPRVVEHDVQSSDLPRRIRSVDLGGRSPGRSFPHTANPFSLKHTLAMAEFVRLEIHPGSRSDARKPVKSTEGSSTSLTGQLGPMC